MQTMSALASHLRVLYIRHVIFTADMTSQFYRTKLIALLSKLISMDLKSQFARKWFLNASSRTLNIALWTLIDLATGNPRQSNVTKLTLSSSKHFIHILGVNVPSYICPAICNWGIISTDLFKMWAVIHTQFVQWLTKSIAVVGSQDCSRTYS